MASVSQTISAFALTLADAHKARNLFDLARVIEGHADACSENFRVLQTLFLDDSELPDFLPLSGIHRKSFAKCAAKALAQRVFDLPEPTKDGSNFLKVNASAMLAVADDLPLDKLADTIRPCTGSKPIIVEDDNGMHCNYMPNSIYLPEMTLIYTNVLKVDGSMRYILGQWLMNDKYKRKEVSSYEDVLMTLRDWVMAPSPEKARAMPIPSSIDA